MKTNNIDRRKFIKLGLGSALASATFYPLLNLANQGTTVKTGTTANPNILFISVDDLNDFISPLGGYEGKIHTPNFERLSKMGVTFEQAFCAAPVCGSSRSSIMSGLSPARTKLMNQQNIFKETHPDNPDDIYGPFATAWDNGNNFTVKSLTQAIKEVTELDDNGVEQSVYARFGTGKIHHGAGFYSSNDFANCPSSYDDENDFESERIYYDSDSWDDYQVLDFSMEESGESILMDYKRPYSRYIASAQELNIPRDEFEKYVCSSQNFKFNVGASYDGDEDRMVDQKSVDYCVKLLGNFTDKPMFLACGLYRPHTAWLVPQKYYDMYPDSEVEIHVPNYDDQEVIWEKLPHIAKHSLKKGVIKDFKVPDNPDESLESLWDDHAHELYQGYLASVSYADDMLGQLLDAVEQRTDKTVIILWSDHGWDLGEKLGWRKSKLWDKATRIPFFIADPDGPKGVRCKRVVSSLDIYPTVMDYVTNGNFTDHAKVDGNSIRSLVNNPNKIWNYGAITSIGIKVKHDPESCDPPNNINNVNSHCENGVLYEVESDPQKTTLPNWSYSHSIRTNRWRYILHDPTSYKEDEFHEELYDHYTDPKERKNLLYASEDKVKHEEVRAMFNKILNSHLGLVT